MIEREPVCAACGAFAADGAGPLPKKVRRWDGDAEVGMVATDVSEEAVWDPLGLHRWHNKRQKVESSAVAGKESSAVADNGMAPRLQINYVTDPPPHPASAPVT